MIQGNIFILRVYFNRLMELYEFIAKENIRVISKFVMYKDG